MKNKVVERYVWACGEVSWFVRLLGFTLVYGWAGNGIPRCLHIERKGKINWFIVTYRTSRRKEWTFYFRRSGKVSWNSEWIAQKFGTAKEFDFGVVHSYQGILGQHMDC